MFNKSYITSINKTVHSLVKLTISFKSYKSENELNCGPLNIENE